MNSDHNNTELIIILGPTASGKTTLAVDLAYHLNGEIISADSRQVYRNMDIGTGKDLSEYERQGKDIPYHLINICEAGDKYNLARFQNDFNEVFEQIKTRDNVPILCGGTGLYIQAIISDFWKSQVPINESFRSELETLDTNIIFEKYESECPKDSYSYCIIDEDYDMHRSHDKIKLTCLITSNTPNYWIQFIFKHNLTKQAYEAGLIAPA